MKVAIVLGDGMADYPIDALQNQTPLEAANKPTIDALAKAGQVGLFQTVPNGMKPGSDVANLSALGYDPLLYYSGRSPLEALSMGANMADDDVAMRLNLVTLAEQNGELYMVDYSAGEISSPEAAKLIAALSEAFSSPRFQFYNGVSYRHCLIETHATPFLGFTPPHDITGKPVKNHLPSGPLGQDYLDLILASHEVLKNHPVNLARVAAGKRPATHLWLWGAGTKPMLPPFATLYGRKGSVVSAVDLLKGIAVGAGLAAPHVEGATGTLATNFVGKTDAVIAEFERGQDFVFLHLEAPDECAHQGDLEGKLLAIAKVDEAVFRIQTYLNQTGEPYALAVLPDHFTPLSTQTHASDPVPFVLYKSNKPLSLGIPYSESAARKGIFIKTANEFMHHLLSDEPSK